MRVSLILAAALLSTSGAQAQTSGGGLGALLGAGGVPNLGRVGAGNAAGMLSYCVKNQLLGNTASGSGSGLLGRFAGNRTATPAPAPTAAANATQTAAAQSVLGQLLGRRDITSSPGFAAGQSGQLQLGGGGALPVASLQDQVKSRLCSAMLSRARAFL